MNFYRVRDSPLTEDEYRAKVGRILESHPHDIQGDGDGSYAIITFGNAIPEDKKNALRDQGLYNPDVFYRPGPDLMAEFKRATANQPRFFTEGDLGRRANPATAPHPRNHDSPDRSAPVKLGSQHGGREQEATLVSEVNEAIHRHIYIKPGTHLKLERTTDLPYTLKNVIGTGSSCHVEMVEDRNTGTLYAHKVFKTLRRRQAMSEFLNELSVFRQLGKHRHIVSVHASYETLNKRQFGLILSPLAEKDLTTFLSDTMPLPLSDPRRQAQKPILQKAFGCLAATLAWIYGRTVRHKDIKPGNILVHNGSVLYTDFGIANYFGDGDDSTTTGPSQGYTRRYCAPEVAAGQPRNAKSDIFSLGCVYVEILAALFPGSIDPEFTSKVFHGTLGSPAAIENQRRVSEHEAILAAVTWAMMNPTPQHRPDATTVAGVLLSHTPRFLYSCRQCVEDALTEGADGELLLYGEKCDIPTFDFKDPGLEQLMPDLS